MPKISAYPTSPAISTDDYVITVDVGSMTTYKAPISAVLGLAPSPDLSDYAALASANVFTEPQAFAAGAVGTPSVTFNGDLDSGLYSVGANQVGVAAGGSLAATFSKSIFDSTVNVSLSAYVGINTSGNSARHLTIMPAVGKTGLFVDMWQDGQAVAATDSNGNVVASLDLTSNSPRLTMRQAAGTNGFVVENFANGNDGVTIGLDASARGDLRINTSSGAASISLNSIGSWHNPSLFVGATSGSVGSKFRVDAGAAATIAAIFRGAASQTAALTQWQDSAGTPLSVISALGYVGLGTGTPSEMLTVSGGYLRFHANTAGADDAYKGTYLYGQTGHNEFLQATGGKPTYSSGYKITPITTSAVMQLNNVSGFNWYTPTGLTAGALSASLSPAMTLTGGMLGINRTTSLAGMIHVVASGTTTSGIVSQAASGGSGAVFVGRDGTGTTTFQVGPTGNVVANGGVTTTANPSGATSLVAREYVESRGQNLITNGSGLMGDNYNFSTLTFDPIETHGGGGSFKYVGVYTSKISDELIPVDPEKQYRLSFWAKHGDTGGNGYAATNRQYVGVVEIDADSLTVAPVYVQKFTGSTDTTLAVALNPGDTTVTLTNATGWHNTGTGHMSHFVWWPYTNAKGYTYPNYTYSRNHSMLSNGSTTVGLWGSGGISGNVITLSAPWAGPALPSGTPVRNCQSGGSYKYIGISNGIVPNAWTKYEGVIGGFDTDANGSTHEFSYGTAYVKLVFLCNYTSGDQTPTNIIRYSDITFGELPTMSMPSLADSVAPNSSLYYSTTQGKLVWKNASGTVNALY